ncbi:MAG TPA: hypothetical protein VLA75_06460 [Thermoanaerobaculia bacterium]|nr:hypothetical protein [Thermoanaerobaculia bacterium]
MRDDLRTYFHDRFPAQLGTLTFERPSEIVGEITGDPGALYFGGSGAERLPADLARIPERDRAPFVLCLFLIVLTDQALYTHFPAAYPTWRRQTRFPKLGHIGFGTRNLDPFLILDVAEREGAVEPAALVALAPALGRLWVGEGSAWLAAHLPEVHLSDLLERMRNDPGWSSGEGLSATAVREAITGAGRTTP